MLVNLQKESFEISVRRELLPPAIGGCMRYDHLDLDGKMIQGKIFNNRLAGHFF